MIDLPTLIALIAPVLLLVTIDRVFYRAVAHRRSRAVAARAAAPEVLEPTAMGIAPYPSAQATDPTVEVGVEVDVRRVA
jgi:4'-phosphopantetheinyl transferase EntD